MADLSRVPMAGRLLVVAALVVGALGCAQTGESGPPTVVPTEESRWSR